MTLIALVDDLLFQAKIRQTAAPRGVDVHFVKTPAAAEARWSDPAVAVVDLHLAGTEPLAAIRVLRANHPAAPIIAYGSHVEAGLLAQARAAGCTTVLPRSALIQHLSRVLSS